jgi:hypothetical protein
MPKIGLTIDEAEVIEWLVEVGAAVVAGQPLVVVNADKTELEVEAPSDGTLHSVVVSAGEIVEVAGVLGTLDVGDLGQGALVRPERTQVRSEAPALPATVTTTQEHVAKDAGASDDPPRCGIPRSRLIGRHPSSPRARAVARELGVDVLTIAGSGPGGRVVERDVRTAQRRSLSPQPMPVSVTAHVRIGPTLGRQRRERAAGRRVGLVDLVIDALGQSLTLQGVDGSVGLIALTDGFRLVHPGRAPATESAEPRLESASGSAFVVVDASEYAIADVRPELWSGCPLTISIGSAEQRPVVRRGEFDIAEEVTIVIVGDPTVWPSPRLIELAGDVIALLEAAS